LNNDNEEDDYQIEKLKSYRSGKIYGLGPGKSVKNFTAIII
jgi:hypothetical protein